MMDMDGGEMPRGDEPSLPELAQRLRRVEDELALYRLIAAYGPAVDAGDGERAASLWCEDGDYVVGGLDAWHGQQEIAGMVAGQMHQSLILAGAAHVMGLPQIELDGDRAVAVTYSRLYLREGEGFRVARVSVNRWEFERASDGWRIRRRINRLLDGSASARQLLTGAAPD